ncbi:MAG: amidophosphoribosyltransferase [Candidatus Methanofastidiosia archaeon]
MCGIVGVWGDGASERVLRGLCSIQHRGQDSCGIFCAGKERYMKKDVGLVLEVLKNFDFKARVAIGHVRYPTVGTNPKIDAQPFFEKNVAVVHNGNVVNISELRAELRKKGICFKSKNDAEVILNVLIEELQENDVFDAVSNLMDRVLGGYSVLAVVDEMLIAFRDPHGIRPLVFSENDQSFMFASESVALDVNSFSLIYDVKPGEVVLIASDVERKRLKRRERFHCMFEWVYFSRPDSVIEGRSVYEARLELGKNIEFSQDADVVIPIPDTARTAALGFSEKNGIPYREGLIKNRYVGRTFIMPTQKERKKAVENNLNIIKSEIVGKKVVLVDDSIVRGTTSKKIVKMVRKAGARKVFLASSCPEIKFPCYYGIDFPSKNELISGNIDCIGADKVIYQSIDGLKRAIGVKGLCTACLDGCYPVIREIESFEALREKERAVT